MTPSILTNSQIRESIGHWNGAWYSNILGVLFSLWAPGRILAIPVLIIDLSVGAFGFTFGIFGIPKSMKP